MKAGNIIIFLFLIIFCGCIPYGYETVSQKIIGERLDAGGKLIEKIVRYDKKLKFIGIIGHDGIFRPGYVCYSRYSAFADNLEYPIDALEHFPQLQWSDIKEAVPVPGSDRWITYEYKVRDINEVEVTLTIFSVKKGKIFRHKFERVKRNPPSDMKTLFGFYMESAKDLSYLAVHEIDKISRVDTLTGEITGSAPEDDRN